MIGHTFLFIFLSHLDGQVDSFLPCLEGGGPTTTNIVEILSGKTHELRLDSTNSSFSLGLGERDSNLLKSLGPDKQFISGPQPFFS